MLKDILVKKALGGIELTDEVLATLPAEQRDQMLHLKDNYEIIDITTTNQAERSAACAASLRVSGNTFPGRFTYKAEITDGGKLLVTAQGL